MVLLFYISLFKLQFYLENKQNPKYDTNIWNFYEHKPAAKYKLLHTINLNVAKRIFKKKDL